MAVNPVIIRNILRYCAGALVARGIIGAETGTALAADPVLIEATSIAAGLALGAATEAIYAVAKRLGWRT